jgi:FMN-dependent NADH-azoreductase
MIAIHNADKTCKRAMSHQQSPVCGLNVFGVPMHNFGVPSVLKLWIDQIARVGRTFSYADGTPKGRIIGKNATFIIATGGIYDAQTKMASFNFVEPYLRSVFGFLGVRDASFLTAGGTGVLNQGHDRDAFLAPHLQGVQTHAQTSQGGHA